MQFLVLVVDLILFLASKILVYRKHQVIDLR